MAQPGYRRDRSSRGPGIAIARLKVARLAAARTCPIGRIAAANPKQGRNGR